jgi:colanic acid/amylovoran biosynthesis protein
MGDIAMLQVTVARLHDLWPQAAIQVFTQNPAALRTHCPLAVPLENSGPRHWFADKSLLFGIYRWLPGPLAKWTIELKRSVRRRQPAVLEALYRLKRSLGQADAQPVLSFLDTLRTTDLFVASGAGGITDHAGSWANPLLDIFEAAVHMNKPVVMFSHGLGPLRDARLLARARAILPKLRLIALREKMFGPAILESLGASPDRVLITGDDAIELAWTNRRAELGSGLGVNLRISKSAMMSESAIERIRPILHRFAARQSAQLIPVPISFKDTRGAVSGGDYSDVESIRRLQLTGTLKPEDSGQHLATPLEVIRQAGKCRVVVTGAYHAAVFALSQGISTVTVSASEYFENKLLGLYDQFGAKGACIRLQDPRFEEKLEQAIEMAWRNAERARPSLLAKAMLQIEQSRAAYGYVGQLCGNAAPIAQATETISDLAPSAF